MLFAELPPEALHEVFSRLATSIICKLWFCGSKSLQKKMADRSGVRKMYISCPGSTRPPAWPKLASAFPYLRELTFNAISRSFPAQFSISDILSLPPNLKRLTMTFHDDLQLFQAAFLASPEHFSELNILSVRGETPTTPSSLIAPLIWPPNLTELRLGRVTALPLNIAFLPPHLTYLSAHVNQLIWNEGEPAFPQTLTSLEMSTDTALPDLFRLLPRTLQRLSTSFYSPQSSYHDWDTIPPSLTYLSFDISTFARGNWEKLPRNLQSLYLSLDYDHRVPEDLMHVLPPTLTQTSAIFPMRITPSIAKLLPRDLVEIDEEIQWQSIPHLPRNLKSISINIGGRDG